MLKSSAILLAFSAIVATIHVCDGFGAGAPLGRCSDMTPNHDGVPAQTDVSPFTLGVVNGNLSSDPLVVAIFSRDADRKFKGFFIQARKADGDPQGEAIGEFLMFPGHATQVQFLNCFDKPNSAATHRENSDKNMVTMQWKPPADFHGKVRFRATVVEEYHRFWTDLQSEMHVDSLGNTAYASLTTMLLAVLTVVFL